jgi:hypothetical protein
MPVSAKNAVFKIQNASGTLTDISSDLNSISFPREVETKETTTFGSGTAKTYTALLEENKISISGYWSTAIDSTLSGIVGMSRSFEFGPIGSTAGNPKYTGSCYLSSYQIEASPDDLVTFSAEFVITGAVTRGTY